MAARARGATFHAAWVRAGARSAGGTNVSGCGFAVFGIPAPLFGPWDHHGAGKPSRQLPQNGFAWPAWLLLLTFPGAA